MSAIVSGGMSPFIVLQQLNFTKNIKTVFSDVYIVYISCFFSKKICEN